MSYQREKLNILFVIWLWEVNAILPTSSLPKSFSLLNVPPHPHPPNYNKSVDSPRKRQMIVTSEMPGTTPDTIMLKHQVLNLTVRNRVEAGVGGVELVRSRRGSERVRQTDR